MAKKRRWWWSKKKLEREVWIAAMEIQKENMSVLSEPPLAKLLIVNRSSEFDWNYTVFDYDPDNKRMLAGQLEGIMAPWLMSSNFSSLARAIGAGIYSIQMSGWTGDIVLRNKTEETFVD